MTPVTPTGRRRQSANEFTPINLKTAVSETDETLMQVNLSCVLSFPFCPWHSQSIVKLYFLQSPLYEGNVVAVQGCSPDGRREAWLLLLSIDSSPDEAIQGVWLTNCTGTASSQTFDYEDISLIEESVQRMRRRVNSDDIPRLFTLWTILKPPTVWRIWRITCLRNVSKLVIPLTLRHTSRFRRTFAVARATLQELQTELLHQQSHDLHSFHLGLSPPPLARDPGSALSDYGSHEPSLLRIRNSLALCEVWKSQVCHALYVISLSKLNVLYAICHYPQLKACRSMIESHVMTQCLSFEWDMLRRTIMRIPSKPGFSSFVLFILPEHVYIRCFQYGSLAAFPRHLAAWLSSRFERNIIIDCVVNDDDYAFMLNRLHSYIHKGKTADDQSFISTRIDKAVEEMKSTSRKQKGMVKVHIAAGVLIENDTCHNCVSHVSSSTQHVCTEDILEVLRQCKASGQNTAKLSLDALMNDSSEHLDDWQIGNCLPNLRLSYTAQKEANLKCKLYTHLRSCSFKFAYIMNWEEPLTLGALVSDFVKQRLHMTEVTSQTSSRHRHASKRVKQNDGSSRVAQLNSGSAAPANVTMSAESVVNEAMPNTVTVGDNTNAMALQHTLFKDNSHFPSTVNSSVKVKWLHSHHPLEQDKGHATLSHIIHALMCHGQSYLVQNSKTECTVVWNQIDHTELCKVLPKRFTSTVFVKPKDDADDTFYRLSECQNCSIYRDCCRRLTSTPASSPEPAVNRHPVCPHLALRKYVMEALAIMFLPSDSPIPASPDTFTDWLIAEFRESKAVNILSQSTLCVECLVIIPEVVAADEGTYTCVTTTVCDTHPCLRIYVMSDMHSKFAVVIVEKLGESFGTLRCHHSICQKKRKKCGKRKKIQDYCVHTQMAFEDRTFVQLAYESLGIRSWGIPKLYADMNLTMEEFDSNLGVMTGDHESSSEEDSVHSGAVQSTSDTDPDTHDNFYNSVSDLHTVLDIVDESDALSETVAGTSHTASTSSIWAGVSVEFDKQTGRFRPRHWKQFHYADIPIVPKKEFETWFRARATAQHILSDDNGGLVLDSTGNLIGTEVCSPAPESVPRYCPLCKLAGTLIPVRDTPVLIYTYHGCVKRDRLSMKCSSPNCLYSLSWNPADEAIHLLYPGNIGAGYEHLYDFFFHIFGESIGHHGVRMHPFHFQKFMSRVIKRSDGKRCEFFRGNALKCRQFFQTGIACMTNGLPLENDQPCCNLDKVGGDGTHIGITQKRGLTITPVWEPPLPRDPFITSSRNMRAPFAFTDPCNPSVGDSQLHLITKCKFNQVRLAASAVLKMFRSDCEFETMYDEMEETVQQLPSPIAAFVKDFMTGVTKASKQREHMKRLIVIAVSAECVTGAITKSMVEPLSAILIANDCIMQLRTTSGDQSVRNNKSVDNAICQHKLSLLSIGCGPSIIKLMEAQLKETKLSYLKPSTAAFLKFLGKHHVNFLLT